MSAAERVFSVLLKAYPVEFRAAYGREMMLVFRDHHREAGTDALRFWSEIAWDVARSAPSLRLDEWRARRAAGYHHTGGIMTTFMAVLAILIGAIEAVNASVEAWSGGIVNHDSSSMLAGVLGAAAGVFLLTSGIALLRRTPGATSYATRVALACLGVFIITGFVVPRMSAFATLLGIAFPIAMLIFVRISSGPVRGAPRIA